jgi:hypothetical protein
MVTNIQKFKLIKVEKPVTDKSVILKDTKVGGLRLCYEVSEVELIPKKYFFGLITIKSKKVKHKENIYFLKPYKHIWFGKDMKKVPKHERGNPNSPFAGVWLEINPSSEYNDWYLDKAFITLKFEKVTNHPLIARLNNTDIKFVLPIISLDANKNAIVNNKRPSLILFLLSLIFTR